MTLEVSLLVGAGAVTSALLGARWYSHTHQPVVEVPPPHPRDLEVEAIIRQVDPSWSLGDDRSHIDLVPGPDGHIESARLL